MFVPDEVMLILAIGLFLGSLYYGTHNHKWVVTMWALPSLWLIAFYALLTWGPQNIETDTVLRTTLHRPGTAGLFFLVVVFLWNGRVNDLLSQTLNYLRRTWFSICRH